MYSGLLCIIQIAALVGCMAAQLLWPQASLALDYSYRRCTCSVVMGHDLRLLDCLAKQRGSLVEEVQEPWIWFLSQKKS